jgi:hypothetical protein
MQQVHSSTLGFTKVFDFLVPTEPPLLERPAVAEPALAEPAEEQYLTTRAEYLDALFNMCPDNMRSKRCRTFREYQEKGYVFGCPAMNTCTKDFSHDGFIHTLHQCKAKYGEDCTRVAPDGRWCLQRVTLYHVPHVMQEDSTPRVL